jgi:hypothetical protein
MRSDTGFPFRILEEDTILRALPGSFSSSKLLMFLPVRKIHRALHFILAIFTFRAEARPISAAGQTGWRRSLRGVGRHLTQLSTLRALIA